MARPGHHQQGHDPGHANTEYDRCQRAADRQRRTQDRYTQAAAHKDRAHGGGQRCRITILDRRHIEVLEVVLLDGPLPFVSTQTENALLHLTQRR